MQIGFIGLGRLGLPVAVCMAQKRAVMGFDIDPQRMRKTPQDYVEAGPDGTGDFNDWLAKSEIRFAEDLDELCAWSDIIFVAVQTPHDPEYEGVTPLPNDRKDFDYRHLRFVISQLAGKIKKPTTIAVISTVLPGTMRREIIPLGNLHMQFAYCPAFPAMGTVMRDFLNPEFVLIGYDEHHDKGDAVLALERAFAAIIKNPPIHYMTIESAELTKVGYNAYIGVKIMVANTLGQIADAIPGCHINDVSEALKVANRRITGPAYMNAGMGDSGSCHPRDNIALSWLSRRLDLPYDIFDKIMTARELHAGRLARQLVEIAEDSGLPMMILGYAFKPESALVDGSHARLVQWFVEAAGRKVEMHDPIVEGTEALRGATVALIGCKHAIFADYPWAEGSVILDPFRYIPDQPGVTVHRIGE